MIKVKILYEQHKHGSFAYAVDGYPAGGISRQPLLDACRQLHDRCGVPDDQYAGLYRGDKLSMTCQIGYGRKTSVWEDGLRLAAWKPQARFASRG